jgi:hypothetical protein
MYMYLQCIIASIHVHVHVCGVAMEMTLFVGDRYVHVAAWAFLEVGTQWCLKYFLIAFLIRRYQAK